MFFMDCDNEDDIWVWRHLNITIPFKHKFLDWISVSCPTCKAKAGRKCVGADGHYLYFLDKNVHASRHIARKGYKMVRLKVPA